MFKRQLISLTLLWLILVFGVFRLLHTFSPETQIAYQQLMNFSDGIEKEKLEEGKKSSPTQQTRYQVSKQIFYKKEAQRLQSRLASEHSELIFNPKGKEAELVEHFKGLTCAIQEKFMDASNDERMKNADLTDNLLPKQCIRYLKAQEAVYSYKTGQLDAEEVEVAHYLVPGLVWQLSLDPFSPLLLGHAQKLQLSMFKELTLKAQGFRATFFDWGEEW
jgi:hypothetical protein